MQELQILFKKTLNYEPLEAKKYNLDKNITFILLNPNIAGALITDRTVMNATNYAVEEGYGSITFLNLFPYKSLRPKKLVKNSEIYIKKNRFYIKKLCIEADLIIIGWGARGEYKKEKKEVFEILKEINKDNVDVLKCFEINTEKLKKLKDTEKIKPTELKILNDPPNPPLHLRNYNKDLWKLTTYKYDLEQNNKSN